MASSDSHIDKPQCGRPKRAELPDVNINTGMQSINTERASLKRTHTNFELIQSIVLLIIMPTQIDTSSYRD